MTNDDIFIAKLTEEQIKMTYNEFIQNIINTGGQ